MATKMILVLGIHRSGSSAVTGVLNRGGIHTGDRMLGPTPANPKGHFENRDFLELNDRVVGDWRKPKVAPAAAQLNEYEALVAGLEDQPVSAIKDPRLCLTAKYLAPMIDWLSIIVVQRDIAVASYSLADRDNMPYERAYGIQRRYLQGRDEFLLSQDALSVARFDLDYDTLIDSPDDVVPALLGFAYDGTGGEPTDDQVERAIRFVDPELRHHGKKAAGD